MRSPTSRLLLLASLGLAAACDSGSIDLGADAGAARDGGPIDAGADGDAPPEPTGPAMTLLVSAHPSWELAGWGMFADRPDDFRVVITMTLGEATTACEPDVGPARYQGPGSPVGQPDLGERILATTWSGRWTEGCAAARLDGWHRFLDLMAEVDPTLPVGPLPVAEHCFDGDTAAGLPPRRSDADPAVFVESRCADVWVGEGGARIAFDLGDSDLTADEVAWALAAVRDNRVELGLPDRPIRGIIGAAMFNATASGGGTPLHADCQVANHGDTMAIRDVLVDRNLRAGTQWQRTCATDPAIAASGGRVITIDPDVFEHAVALDPDTQARLGAMQVAHGWQTSGAYATCAEGCQYSAVQGYSRR